MRTASSFRRSTTRHIFLPSRHRPTDTTDTADATDTVDTANQSGRFTTDRRVMLPSSVDPTSDSNFQPVRRVMLHNIFAPDARSQFECYKQNVTDNILSEIPSIINSGFQGRKVVTKQFFFACEPDKMNFVFNIFLRNVADFLINAL